MGICLICMLASSSYAEGVSSNTSSSSSLSFRLHSLQELEQLVQAFEKDSREVAQLEAQRAELLERYQMLSLGLLREKAAEKKKEHVPLESLKTTICQLQAEKADIQQTDCERKERLVRMEAQIQSLQADQCRIKQEIEQRQQLLAGIEKELAALSKDKAVCDKEIDDARQRAQALQQRYSRIQQEARSEIAAFEQEVISQAHECSLLEQKQRELSGYQALLKDIVENKQVVSSKPQPAQHDTINVRDAQIDLALAQARVESPSPALEKINALLQKQAALLSASHSLDEGLRDEQKTMRELQERAGKVDKKKGQ
jgi:chromosome segregation ATPase